MQVTTNLNQAQAQNPKKKLTVLYFIDGKNNLSSMAAHSFKSLDQVGSDDNVNVVAELGLMKQSVVRGLVTKGGGADSFQLAGTSDMGSPASVADFVEWGMKNYPAEKYALVLWNHGAGFKGILTDEEAGTMCQNKDLAQALEQVKQKTGQDISVLNFNACLMGQAEVAYEYRNVAKYMVGSQEVEAGLRIPIPGLFGTTPQHKVLEDVQEAYAKGRNLSDEELASLFVYETKKQFGTSLFSPTQSAVDLSQAGGVRDACENLAGKVLQAMQADPSLVDQLRKDIKSAQNFCKIDAHIEPYVDYKDLGDFAKVLSKDEKFPADVRAAAQQVLEAAGKAVSCEQHATVSGFVGRSMEGSTGLSVYLPTDYGFDREGKSPVEGVPVGGTHGYEKTSFGQNSQWEAMLKTIAKDDDLLGRYPKLARSMMSFGQISRLYGYEFALDAALGVGAVSTFNWYPLMSFPYLLPIPGVVACAAGAVGAALRTHSGISKLAEAIRRDDAP
ncbi:MAG: clostripain-related cysteine peptidase, partial [Candidatus Eremiobacterota bacterium]